MKIVDNLHYNPRKLQERKCNHGYDTIIETTNGRRYRTGFNGLGDGAIYLFPYDFPAAEIKARLKEFGLTQAIFNLPPGDWASGERGIAGLPSRMPGIRARC